MQTVLVSQMQKGEMVSMTIAAAIPFSTPPWIQQYYGWCACDQHDRVIFAKPELPLIARSPQLLTKKLIKNGLVLHIDDE